MSLALFFLVLYHHHLLLSLFYADKFFYFYFPSIFPKGVAANFSLQPITAPPDILWFPGGGVPAVMHVLTIHPIEMARQLTLIETELFRSVEMSELIGLRWTKKGKEQNARHVLALVHRFNLVSNWVIRTIVETPNLQERADVIMYFLEVLRELRELKNFNGVMELVSALQTATITRLTFTFAELSSKRLKVLEECADQMSQERNFKRVRSDLANVEGQ